MTHEIYRDLVDIMADHGTVKCMLLSDAHIHCTVF